MYDNINKEKFEQFKNYVKKRIEKTLEQLTRHKNDISWKYHDNDDWSPDISIIFNPKNNIILDITFNKNSGDSKYVWCYLRQNEGQSLSFRFDIFDDILKSIYGCEICGNYFIEADDDDDFKYPNHCQICSMNSLFKS
jgi:hypothetical protein